MPPTSSESTRRDLLLDLIALSGDFPTSLLDKLDGSEHHTRDEVHKLLGEKLIRRYKGQKPKSLRLTQKCRDMLLANNRNRFCMLLEGSGRKRGQKATKSARRRLHQMAVGFLMMLECGVRVHRDEKAPIFEVYPTEVDMETRERIMRRWTTPCYYSSVEIKYMPLSSRRIQGTRALGLLIPEDPLPNLGSYPYLLFYVESQIANWSSDKETQLASSIFTTLNLWDQHYQHAGAIMIGATMQAFVNLMRIRTISDEKFISIASKSSFSHFHFVPLNGHGKLMLRYLCNQTAKRSLEARIRSEYGDAPEQYKHFQYDAYDAGTDQYVFFGWDMDMKTLANYETGLRVGKHKGLIICLDFQAESYRELLRDIEHLVEYRLLEIDIIKKELLDGT